MGELRKRAEKERAERLKKRTEGERLRLENEERRHKEKAQNVADYLTEWGSEFVAPADVAEAKDFFSGFHSYWTWRVMVDGFDLVVKQAELPMGAHEEGRPRFAFVIYQVAEDGETRPIKSPGDLLEPVAVREPVKPGKPVADLPAAPPFRPLPENPDV